MGQEDGFTSQNTLACTKKLAKESFIWAGTITHFGLKGNPVFHIIHGTGLGNDGFSGIEFHLDHLKVVANHFVVDFIATY